jgi:23S rRNA (uracil1939-C5)-methyltransferase
MPVELTITGMAAGGDAIARDEHGKVTFVRGALPGERVLVEITDRRKDFDRAVVVDVIDPAVGRIAPPCPYVELGCGGCSWQHVDVAMQRSLKLGIVEDALRRIGRIADPAVALGPELPSTGYRTTVRLATGTGFRHARSHDVVEVDACLVAHPLLAPLFAVDYGRAKEVTLRCGARTGERLVLTDPAKIRIDVPADVHVGPRSFIHEEVAGHRFRISATSFFQARPDGADALVDLVRAAAEGAPDGRMIDAYGGVGLFSATLGRPDAHIVEWSKSSMHDARENVPHAKVVACDVARWRPSPAELVVADPPRTGLGADAAAVLAATEATHLVLVSCDPAALARDARLLADHGFVHDGTTLVDLFPHTPHVEAVTRFIR